MKIWQAKYLGLITTIILFSLAARGQGPYTPLASYGYEWKRGIFDSSLCIPYQDTVAKSIGFRAGFITIKPSNNVAYIYNGTSWQTFASGTGGTGTVTSVNNGYGIICGPVTSVGSLGVDTIPIATRLRVQKAIDSLNAIISNKGTVNSVSTGYGLNGGTITNAGTLLVDTTSIASRLRVQKAIDSLNTINVTHVTAVTGTTNRTTSTGGTTPNIDISSTFEALLGKVASPLSQFSSTTSVQLANTISDESGSGSLIFGNTPTLSNPIVGTQSIGDNSTKAASTAFTNTAINNAIAATNPAVAVQVASTTNISGYTYNNGASGIGATLTQTVAGIVVIDGYTLLLNDRVLFKDQTSTFTNGVYVITTLGTGIIPAVFTRALDYNQPSDINSTGPIPVINGNDYPTGNKGSSWQITSTVNTIGTDALSYIIFTYEASKVGLTTNPLSQFATTTSSQLLGVISDETGSGALVFANTPTLITPIIGAATGTSLVLTANSSARSYIPGYTTTATASATTTLTSTSTQIQRFTGTLNQTAQLPSTTGLTLGQLYNVINESTGVITINNSSGTLVQTVQPSSSCKVIVESTGAETWSNEISVPTGAWISFGGGTLMPEITGVTVAIAKYQVVGKTCFIALNYQGATSTSSSAVTIILPFVPAINNYGLVKITNAGSNLAGLVIMTAGTTSATISAGTSTVTTWSSGGLRAVIGSFNYEMQ